MSGRASRREVLAFVALQGLPTPHVVQMVDMMSVVRPTDALRLRFYGPTAEAVMHAWADLLGAGEPYVHVETACDEPYRDCSMRGQWRGWPVHLRSTVPLDDETLSKLREIARGDR